MSCSSFLPRSALPARPVVSAVAAGLLLATACTSQAATFNGSGALTTDYVWRGTTQTQGDPAVQAGFKAAADNGLYGAIWGSNVEFAPATKASSELDVTVGWGGTLSDAWALDVNLTHYRYPSTTVDLGYYWLDDAYDDSYAHAQLGAVWAFKAPFELRVTAHATDSSAKTLFPGLAGSRVEAALQASF